MESLRNSLVLLWALAMLSTVSYAQSFNNVPVDVGSGDQSETSIAIKPSNPAVLMATWNDFANNNYPVPGYAFSTDSGRSWFNVDTLKGLNSNGYYGGFDPSCAIDNAGRDYFAFVHQDGTQSNLGQIYIEYTTDNGSNWNGPFDVSGTLNTEDKPYMAIDNSGDSTNGRTYVAWRDTYSNGNTTYLAFPSNQSDLNAPWIRTAVSATYNNEVEIGAVPAVGPDGIVYVVDDSDANNATSYINVAMSKNSGNSFPFNYTGEGFPGLFNQQIGHLRVTSLPTIAVDPSNGEVYVAWAQNDGGSQGMDIYFMHTTGAEEITSWTSPKIATQTTTGNQFFPWLTINSAGHISLVYYQENSNGDVDVYSAQSYDGQSFVGQNGTGQDVKLTSVSSNPAVGATDKASDYIGVASDGSGEVHALWTDFRSNTNQDIYCANYNQQPTVTLTGPTYIDAGGSGAYYLINGSPSSSI